MNYEVRGINNASILYSSEIERMGAAKKNRKTIILFVAAVIVVALAAAALVAYMAIEYFR